MIWVFLIYSFLIAWGSETTIIVLYRLNLLDEKLMQILYYVLLGAGCGMAPAMQRLLLKGNMLLLTWKGFLKKIFGQIAGKEALPSLSYLGQFNLEPVFSKNSIQEIHGTCLSFLCH